MHHQKHWRSFSATLCLIILSACTFSARSSQTAPGPSDISGTNFPEIPDAAPTATVPGLDSVPDVDLESLITLHTAAEIETRRLELLDFVFGAPALPELELKLNTYQPDERALAYLAPWMSAHPDFLTLEMDHGLISNLILLHAEHPGETLVIYHTGHGGLVEGDQENVLRLLDTGYDVLFISLPLTGINNPFGPNPPAVAQTTCCGTIEFVSGVNGHAQLASLEHPLKYFFEPLAAAVDFAQEAGYARLALVGISGGGWAAVVYSALDPRIDISFPVAGSLPLWMRIPDYEGGDFEQQYPPFYDLAGYLDLYLMGASGEGRSQLQIFNYYDPCCYGGDRALVYLDLIQTRLASLGPGAFDIHIDRSQTMHRISPEAIDVIMAALDVDRG